MLSKVNVFENPHDPVQTGKSNDPTADLGQDLMFIPLLNFEEKICWKV